MEKFINWWQHIPENIVPYFFKAGSFELRYYGLMYVAAFVLVYILVICRLKNERFEYSRETIQNYFTWGVLGILAGGRLGYVLFYDLGYFLSHPLQIILPFDFSQGVRYTGIYGMSYHGGLLGLVFVTIIFCRSHKINFWRFTDFLVPAVPLGYTFGRIGNFINGELYGRITTVWWGMYFPLDPSGNLRHPSQLYEAFFEGIFLFLIFWSIRRKKYFNGFFSSLYLVSYGLVRFFVEFVREPDSHLGFILGPLTMGQVLCVFMAAGGICALFLLKKK